jgi:holo-[acyl-carrier protein] synthase
MVVDGVGVDIVEVSRIARMMKKKGFLARVFTEAEIRECQKVRHPEQAFAARFAAKEAVGKALGTGVGSRLSWLDIEIIRRPKGKPNITISDSAKERFQVSSVKISMSHTEQYAVAVAIVNYELRITN